MRKQPSGIRFNDDSCRFEDDINGNIINDLPLSVILQITRRCDFSCIFCSETKKMKDPTLRDMEKMRNNLRGVPRVYLSGGEPLLRSDFVEILNLFSPGFIVGLPTNGVLLNETILNELKKKISFVNVGIDDPRSITSEIRGDYDKIMKGIFAFKNKEISLSLSCVVLGSTVTAVPYVCQIADVVGAKKIKLILPVPKGNALDLPESEFITTEDARILFSEVKELKKRFGWNVKITLTTWNKDVEGYSLLVFPDGDTYAWPVYDKEDKVLLLGNLIDESISNIWARNPFKENHFKKYLGKSILVA